MSHTVWGLRDVTQYEFRIRAVAENGKSDWSESSVCETLEAVSRPTDFSVEIQDEQVVLLWQPPDDADETGVTAYDVAAWRYRHPEPGDAANKRVDAQRPWYVADNIAPGCSLAARVRAVGRAGTSGYAYLDPALRDPWPQERSPGVRPDRTRSTICCRNAAAYGGLVFDIADTSSSQQDQVSAEMGQLQ